MVTGFVPGQERVAPPTKIKTFIGRCPRLHGKQAIVKNWAELPQKKRSPERLCRTCIKPPGSIGLGKIQFIVPEQFSVTSLTQHKCTNDDSSDIFYITLSVYILCFLGVDSLSPLTIGKC